MPEKIYSSAPDEPDDDFWLQEGKRLVTESLASVRNAANSLTASLGVLQSFYLGIIGFDQLTDFGAAAKALFLLPMALWLIALYLCLAIIMTKKFPVFTNAPSDIRDKIMQLVMQKQNQLQWAFGLLAVGLLAASILLYWRLNLKNV